MKDYDLIVVGGGLSGTCAAISASRHGLHVLLIEKTGSLGGTATNGLVTPFMPTTTKINGKKEELCRGIFEEIKCELEKINELYLNSFSSEALKLILDQMVEKAGVDVLFHTSLIGAHANDGKITSITISNIEGISELSAPYYIDASADAQLIYLSGMDYTLGREGDGLCQPMTLSFRVGGVLEKEFFDDIDNLQEKYKNAKVRGEISCPRENILVFKTTNQGILHFNTTRVIKKSPTNAREISLAEIEGRKQAFEIFNFLKKNAKGMENSVLLQTGAQIGVRESRRVLGEYILTGKDAREKRIFKDTIALSNYDIDIHNPEGEGTSHYYFGEGEYFGVPYRALVPRGAKNVLVAGRCISCDHEAQASIRIMPIVSVIGQVCGIAIAQAKGEEKEVLNIDTSELINKLIEEKVIFNYKENL